MNWNLIGNRIRIKRKEQRLTLEKLAEKSNISANFMGNIERGNAVVSLETLVSIANNLFIGIDYLLNDNLDKYVETDPEDFVFNEIITAVSKMTPRQRKSVLDCINALNDYCDDKRGD